MSTERGVLTITGLVVLVALAGCSGMGGDPTETPPEATPTVQEPAYPQMYDTVVDSLDEENATLFEQVMTGSNDELTQQGDEFLTLLEEVDTLGEEQRNAVVSTVIKEGRIEQRHLDRIEQFLASPQEFQMLAFSYGIVDSNGDGLTEGEAVALGLDASEENSQIGDFTRRLREGGYNTTEIRYLERLIAMDDFEWTQARQLELLSATQNGTVTESDLDAIADDSGDGLVNAMTRRLEFDPETPHENVSRAARALDEDSFDTAGISYLKRYADIRANQFLWEQAAYFGLANQTDGPVTARDVRAIKDDSGDDLINAMKKELGQDPDTQNKTITGFARQLAQGGYDETAIEYLKRVDALTQYRGHEYEFWAQANQTGLLDGAVENGTVTENQLWALQNNDTDRLLNGIEASFGTDPTRADTSNDGYLDHHKWGPMRDIGLDVNPGHPNIYVEVDVAEGVSVPTEEIELLESTLEEEPPDEYGPVYVDFHVCNTAQEDADDGEEMDEVVKDGRNITDLGFHYMLIADGIGISRVQGLQLTRASGNSWMLIDGTIWRTRSSVYQAAVIGHELGHSLGLDPSDYLGIDSAELSHEEYPSIMNYNHDTVLTFSTGDPFNDYREMAEEEYGSWHHDNSALDEMWEAGETPDDALCGRNESAIVRQSQSVLRQPSPTVQAHQAPRP